MKKIYIYIHCLYSKILCAVHSSIIPVVPYIFLKVPENLAPSAIVLPTQASFCHCCAAFVAWIGAGSCALLRNQTTPWAEEFQGLVAEGKFILVFGWLLNLNTLVPKYSESKHLVMSWVYGVYPKYCIT